MAKISAGYYWDFVVLFPFLRLKLILGQHFADIHMKHFKSPHQSEQVRQSTEERKNQCLDLEKQS